jgi:hypothetical protein
VEKDADQSKEHIAKLKEDKNNFLENYILIHKGPCFAPPEHRKEETLYKIRPFVKEFI